MMFSMKFSERAAAVESASDKSRPAVFRSFSFLLDNCVTSKARAKSRNLADTSIRDTCDHTEASRKNASYGNTPVPVISCVMKSIASLILLLTSSITAAMFGFSFLPNDINSSFFSNTGVSLAFVIVAEQRKT